MIVAALKPIFDFLVTSFFILNGTDFKSIAHTHKINKINKALHTCINMNCRVYIYIYMNMEDAVC